MPTTRRAPSPGEPSPDCQGRRLASALKLDGLAYQVLVAKSGLEQGEAIEQARRAAADLGHDRVGTEHTLLGLIRVEESPAAQILRTFGFTSDELHETVKTEIANRFAAHDKR